MEAHNNKLCPATITRPVAEVDDGPIPQDRMFHEETPRPASAPLRHLTGSAKVSLANAASNVRIIHVESLRKIRVDSPMAEYGENSDQGDPEPWHQFEPVVELSPQRAEDEPDDPCSRETTAEPQKKRPRVRRSAEEIKLAVVSNQATLNDNILELTNELKQRNEISANMLQLKKEEMLQNETQHREVMATQNVIAYSLEQILLTLQK